MQAATAQFRFDCGLLALGEFLGAWRLLILLSATALGGCGTIQFYSQSVAGQLEIWRKSRPVEQVLRDRQTPGDVREVLELVQEIRDFARTAMRLPDNESYRSYAALGRPFVVWNVFAAPELSLDPVQSCFPVAGCLNYRGYFSEVRARRYAASLARRGLDTYVGGVSAYSTLGWLRDPVLDTMLRRSAPELVRLVLHELAHQLLYFTDDPDFNEAFAETVAGIGVKQWLSSRPGVEAEKFHAEQAREEAFFKLIIAGKRELEGIYRSDIHAADKRALKLSMASELRNRYLQLSRGWEAPGAYLDWFANGINNARLAAVSTYRELVPDLLRRFTATGENLETFYALAENLKDCSAAARRRWLQSGHIDEHC
ncbi:MAG: aminopeptidase [Gammaproteobacteria bacterium]|nr:aminopeptidase [Gammaproteobacteria bacterium]